MRDRPLHRGRLSCARLHRRTARRRRDRRRLRRSDLPQVRQPARRAAATRDCKSDVCSANVCQATGCNDGRKSGTETDVDCGGAECKKCAASQACAVAGDCATGVCTSLICQASKCDDHVKNGNETDVDCGGGGCAACAAGLEVRSEHRLREQCLRGGCLQATFPLTIVSAGGGSGRVTSTPAAIDCGAKVRSPSPRRERRATERRAQLELDIRRLDRRRVHRNEHVPGHHERGPIGHCHVRARGPRGWSTGRRS